MNTNAEAIQAQVRGYQAFGFPLLTEIETVEHNPKGLSAASQTRAVQQAVDFEKLQIPGLAGALPVPNTIQDVPGTTTPSTTVITYLYFEPGTKLSEQYRGAHQYAAALAEDPAAGSVGVTGAVAARVEAESEIDKALPYVEIGTVLVIALVLAIALRSLLAPLLTLFVAGIAYAVALRVVPAVGDLIDVPVPRELRPLVLVLLLAIVTDYCVFFLTEMRRRLTSGEDPREAAYCTGVRIVPIVVTAGLIVAAGTGTLLLGSLGFFLVLGPGMAVTALVGTAVSLTLVPALLAITGRVLFRGAVPRAVSASEEPPPHPDEGRRSRAARARMRLLGERRLTAAGVALLCIAGLGVLAYQAHDVRLGFTLVEGLPEDAAARQAANDASAGFAPGIIAPTEILVEGQGIASNPDDLVVLQGMVEEQPGVAGTIGPREQTAASRVEDASQLPHAFIAEDGATARMLVVLDSDPFSAQAIDDISRLRGVMPVLQEAAGLGDARVSLAGQTGLAEETVNESLDNVVVLATAALLVNLFFLILFLRALIAPLYLLFSSVLALGATYGITWMIVQALGWGEITYYIPFAAAVLLLSLGSDYTIFVVGRIWRPRARAPWRRRSSTPRRGPRAPSPWPGWSWRCRSPCWRSCRSSRSASSRS